MTRNRVRAITLAVVAVSCGPSIGGCTAGEKLVKPTSATTTTARPIPLPPRDTGALVKVVAPLIPADDEIQRIYLDVSGGDAAVLFSIYVRPRSTRTADDYARGLEQLTRSIIPVLFARYSGVRAIDLCQEPPNALGPDAAPEPVTRVLITRDGADAIDWGAFDLAALRRHAVGTRPDIELQVGPLVRSSARFKAAAPD